MKFPEPQKNIVNVIINCVGTAGLLGIVLVMLIALGEISAWWSILAVICVLSAVGKEHGISRQTMTKDEKDTVK